MDAGSGEALRQQLEAALERFRLTGSADLVYAVVAAARVATATEIAEAIEARCVDGQLCVEEPCFLCNGLKIAADIARRGSVPAPKGDQ